MMTTKNILKIITIITANFIFGFIIYFVSLRPLSPSEEKLIIDFQDKTFTDFTLECVLFVMINTVIFSVLSFSIFWIFYNCFFKKIKLFLILFIYYFVISCIFSLEYFYYIKALIYSS
jgi:hypothetical protein